MKKVTALAAALVLVPVVAQAQERELVSACERGEWSRAEALLLAAAKARPGELGRAPTAKELDQAERVPLVRRARRHAMTYLVVLPRGWSSAKKWPILLALEGAGCVWMNTAGPFVQARGDEPFIVVVPQTTTNTLKPDRAKYVYDDATWSDIEDDGRPEFDAAGIAAVLDDVRERFSGEERVYATGFSGGGIPLWRLILAHPERLAAASPVCANFWGSDRVSSSPERAKLQIRAFQGEKDPARNQLEPQWTAAARACARAGFATPRREVVPGVKHANCAREVVAFFASVRVRAERR